MPSPPDFARLALPAMISAACVALLVMVSFLLARPGPLSGLMVQHLFVMNVIAPLAGAFLAAGKPARLGGGAVLWGAALAQMLLLWGWHAPAFQRAAAASASLHLLMMALLAGAAIVFWAVLLRAGAQGRWSAVGALLLTGKLACLLGGLLVFAPRELYGLTGLALAICGSGPSTLADQQMAGLMMIAACPLSYVTAGLVIAARMLRDLEDHPLPRHPLMQSAAP